MSQGGILNIGGGGGSGSPIMTITGDTGGAVPPTANNINIIGGTSTANNSIGITVAGNAGTSTETVTLTNRAVATLTTTDATTTSLLVFPLGATDGTYLIKLEIAAYSLTSQLSAGYSISGLTMKTLSFVASIIDLPSINTCEEGVFVNLDVNITNLGNNLIVDVTGLAANTIHWTILLNYIFVS